MSDKLKATLRYATTAPDPEQIEKIKGVLYKKLGTTDIDLETVLDSSIGGGFVVSCGNYEYDWSDAGRARQLRAELNNLRRKNGETETEKIITMLSSKVENFDLAIEDRQINIIQKKDQVVRGTFIKM